MEIVGKLLLTSDSIYSRVMELAERISSDYQGKEILAIAVLKGAFMFYADLIRALKVPVTVDFIIASSYHGTISSGDVRVRYESLEDISGKDVLLIDDIIDTGISLKYLRELLLNKRPASLKICVLLDKKERRIANVPIDYLGFEIQNEFVVGYGLDWDGKYRNLPYIAVLKDI